MHVDHHDLYLDCPEYRQDIDALRAGDSHFAGLFAQYNGMTVEVERLEENDLPVGDFTIEELKKKRVKLKDELYAMLRAHKLGCTG